MAGWDVDFLVESHEASRGGDDQVIDVLLKRDLLNILGRDVDDVEAIFGFSVETNAFGQLRSLRAQVFRTAQVN